MPKIRYHVRLKKKERQIIGYNFKRKIPQPKDHARQRIASADENPF